MRTFPVLRPLASAAAVLLLASLAVPAAAQGGRGPTVNVSGQVNDRTAGQPVASAHVWFKDRMLSTYTNASGRFTIADVPVGSHAVRVERLGYMALDTTWVVGAEGGTLAVTLAPDAVVLEELRVRVDELERRRNAAPVAVRLISQERLVASTTPNVLAALGEQMNLRPVPCVMGTNVCARVQGRAVRVRVYIDENFVAGGLAALETYRPQDIYLVEVYGGGSMVRVYTNRYMERVARRKVKPEPLYF